MTRLLKMHLVDKYMLPHRHSAFSYHVVSSGFVILLVCLVVVSGVSLFHPSFLGLWGRTPHIGTFFPLLLTSALLEFMVPAVQETQVQSLGQEDLLEKEMATHSSILA